MPRRIFVVGRSRLVAAAVGIVLLSLASAPAKAGCSKGVTFVQRLLVSLLQTSQSHSCAQPYPIYHPGRDTARVQAAMIRKFGGTAVPRTVIGGVVVEGVDEARIQQLCRQ